MSALIAGVLIIATFLLASVLMFGTFLTSSSTQAQSIKDLGQINSERVGSAITITSATVTSTGSGTDMTVLVDNTGSQSVGNFAQMDVTPRRRQFPTTARNDSATTPCVGKRDCRFGSPPSFIG